MLVWRKKKIATILRETRPYKQWAGAYEGHGAKAGAFRVVKTRG